MSSHTTPRAPAHSAGRIRGANILWPVIKNFVNTRGAAIAVVAILALLAVAVSLTLMTGAEAQSAPATPSSVSLTRADGTVTATWAAVSGATSYHVTYSADGRATWSLAASDHTSDSDPVSITITGADNAKSYVVAVSARKSNEYSEWRMSLPAGPYNPPVAGGPPSPYPFPPFPGFAGQPSGAPSAKPSRLDAG